MFLSKALTWLGSIIGETKKNYVPERIDKRQLRNGNVQKSKKKWV